MKLLVKLFCLIGVLTLYGCGALSPAAEKGNVILQNIQIQLAPEISKSPIAQNIAQLLQRQIQARCGARVNIGKGASTRAFTIRLTLDEKLPREGFRIEGDGGGVLIAGRDERGVLYGVGKFLRASRYDGSTFSPATWRGSDAPQKPLRGIYLATHFHNFYHDAPVGEVNRYVEELGLWGFNTVSVWFDMHGYKSLQDPDAQAMMHRLHAILSAAKAIGLSTSLMCLGNEAYADSPKAMRADWTAGHDGYRAELQGHYHVELCPNQPGATELILKWREEVLASFKDVGLDYLVIWPYDQGGCTCSQCAPWGSNGFLKIAPEIARLYRRDFPSGKVVLSTWYFDKFTSGEWEGLSKRLESKAEWVNYILAEEHPDALKKSAPGNLPLIGFPEISMWGTGGWGPWGGFGASPYPAKLQGEWNKVNTKSAGGFPYSEGIFEDINKAVCAGFYWNNRSADEALREYISYEYSPAVVDDVLKAMHILEVNLTRARADENGRVRYLMASTAGTDEAYQLLQNADAKLSPQAKTAWRWRVLLLRGVIDYELARNDFRITPRAEAALQELTEIYHAQNASFPVAPPTKAALTSHRPV